MSHLSACQERSFGALELRPMLIDVSSGLSLNGRCASADLVRCLCLRKRSKKPDHRFWPSGPVISEMPVASALTKVGGAARLGDIPCDAFFMPVTQAEPPFQYGRSMMELSDCKPRYQSECLRCGRRCSCRNGQDIWTGTAYSICGSAKRAVTSSRPLSRSLAHSCLHIRHDQR